MKITLRDVLNIDYESAVEAIRQYVEKSIREAGAREVVMGLSGGVDSSVLLRLLTEIIGPEKIAVLIMPDTRVTPQEDTLDAIELAEKLGVKYYVVNIDSIVDSYSIVEFYSPNDKLAIGNLRARIRANLLYYYANKYKAIVAGASDRSEVLIGYFTKYGDGAADFYPLACLYKSQVGELGRRLGLPSKITEKPSAPRLWRDHTAESELGVPYEVIDVVLYAAFDRNIDPGEIPSVTSVDPGVVEKIIGLHRMSRHKRRGIIAPELPWLKQPIREL